MRVELMLLVVLSNSCLPRPAVIDSQSSHSVDDPSCEASGPCSSLGGEGGLLALTFAGLMLGVTSLLVLDRSWLRPR